MGPDAEPTLVDVLDRLLDRGVVVAGDLRVSVADVDLLYVGLRVCVASIDAVERANERAREIAAEKRALRERAS
ncbi:MAG: gas vesicle protein [Pseudomonadota bacterium]